MCKQTQHTRPVTPGAVVPAPAEREAKSSFFHHDVVERLQFIWKPVWVAHIHLCFTFTCLWCAEPGSEGLFPHWLLSEDPSAPPSASALLVLPSSVSPFPDHALPRLSEQTSKHMNTHRVKEAKIESQLKPLGPASHQDCGMLIKWWFSFWLQC